MSVPLILAILVAFGIDPTDTLGPMTPPEVWLRVAQTWGAIAILGVSSLVLGRGTLFKLRRVSNPYATRRALTFFSRFLEFVLLALFGLIIYEIRWPEVVRVGLGLKSVVLIDELLILLPFLVGQIFILCSIYPSAALAQCYGSQPNRAPSLLSFVVARSRGSWGMILPIALAFPLGQDLLSQYSPQWVESSVGQLILLAAIGLFIMILSPALVRLTWSTHRLPEGKVRDRLERLAAQNKFKYTEILVWKTEGSLANAGVTGILPWFRYVLLTDGLLEGLDLNEVSAVFGHEMGHIADRHLFYFGSFFLASLSLLAVGSSTFEGSRLLSGSFFFEDASHAWWAGSLVAGVGLIAIASLGLFLFGHLSRSFEREADIHGCRAVSCGREECPPHLDLDAVQITDASNTPACPVGISTFVRALSRVALCNGVSLETKSWRHGSVDRRIRFLERIEDHPQVEDGFRRSMRLVRVGLTVGLVVLLILAAFIGFSSTQT